MSRYDDMSEKARFYLNNHDEIELAEMAASSSARIEQLEKELADLCAGEEPYTDERVVPTPAQWIWLWNQATPEKRLEVAQRVIDNGERASTCFTLNHEGEVHRLRDAMAAIERVREAAAWLRRNYPGLDAGQRVLAALEPPKETHPPR